MGLAGVGQELVEAFPEAKVVLTHVAGSQWALSARQTAFKHHTAWPRRSAHSPAAVDCRPGRVTGVFGERVQAAGASVCGGGRSERDAGQDAGAAVQELPPRAAPLRRRGPGRHQSLAPSLPPSVPCFLNRSVAPSLRRSVLLCRSPALPLPPRPPSRPLALVLAASRCVARAFFLAASVLLAPCCAPGVREWE